MVMSNLFKKRDLKMKSKVVALAVAGLVGLSASADILYWQVNNDSVPTTKGTAAQAYLMATADGNSDSPFYVSENYLGGVNQGESITTASFDGSTLAGGVIDLNKIISWANDPTTASGSGITDASSLSFYIELYDADGGWVGKTTAVSYNDLKNAGAIGDSFNPSFTGVNAALGGAGTTYTDVPEPTSGLLMLVGLGALALRRKRA